ncbi:uncharacterized protein N7484_006090 [Penicillium longicatenatum]|uniref:uncharacterized protein n=1 Tax=Penicillium longicatenatum TaxID=1561947 RepID=UPI002548B9A5|nr:uncharacterized protein N7484_006090 [Penicillium longicatenatum]KAJ5643583.1 hypothetical protein N7484_006090 [Penicillium longicatenatum]
MEKALNLMNAAGIPNFRGFGGYPTTVKGHQETRKGLLYRSAHPGAMTEKGLAQIKERGVRCIIDLTCHDEKTIPYILPLNKLQREGIQVLHRPIEEGYFSLEKLLLKYDTFQERGAEAVSKAYLDLLEKGSTTIRDIILILKANQDAATLIHCSLGKDRTGLIFIILFLLMGVPYGMIEKEYCLSATGLMGSLEIIERFLMQRTNDDPKCSQRALQIITTHAETVQRTISEIHSRYGGAYQYLEKHCDFTKEELSELIDILTDGN